MDISLDFVKYNTDEKTALFFRNLAGKGSIGKRSEIGGPLR